MSWPHIVIYLVVIGIGLPAVLRNPTAGALVANWAIGEATWMLTGDSLPLKVYFMADIAVLAVIGCKATVREGCRTYPDLWQQSKCLWRAMTLWDRWIAASYVLAVWPLYVMPIEPRAQWFLLWALLIAQFLIAGGEAVQSMLGKRKRVVPNREPGGLAYARGGGDG